jgi:mannan endo-1,4-beta-mannosidase
MINPWHHARGTGAMALLALGFLASGAEADNFVRTQGTQFVEGGQPFFVTGVNNHYLPWGSQAEVGRALDDAVAMGANVVRTFLGPVIGSPDGTTIPTIWKPFDEMSSDLDTHGIYLLYWDPARKAMGINAGADGMAHVDWLIAEAAKRHLKLIIAFVDFWSYTGGTYQMSRWYGLPTHTGAPYETSNPGFFTDPRVIADYKDWIKFVVQRINPQTHVAYKDDPTIFAWELANEAHIPAAMSKADWESQMAAYVKSLDPNHLVGGGDDFPVFDAPQIDFVTWHGYPLYARISPAQFNSLIGFNCARAKHAQKPLLLEEFGYARSNWNPDQAQAYRMWLNTMRANPDCAGWLVWRLVSKQDNGHYPRDEYDRFDIRNDGGATWTAVSNAAHQGR